MTDRRRLEITAGRISQLIALRAFSTCLQNDSKSGKFVSICWLVIQ